MKFIDILSFISTRIMLGLLSPGMQRQTFGAVET